MESREVMYLRAGLLGTSSFCECTRDTCAKGLTSCRPKTQGGRHPGEVVSDWSAQLWIDPVHKALFLVARIPW